MHASPETKSDTREVYNPIDTEKRLAGVALLADMLHDANPDVAIGYPEAKQE